MASFLILWETVGATVVADCKKMLSDAKENFHFEHSAGVKIQSQVRRYFERKSYRQKLESAVNIERVFRGHIGRSTWRQRAQEEHTFENFSKFHCHAAMIQTIFRGFYSRRYIHDFRARKAYIQSILDKSDELRHQLAANREKIVREEQERKLEESKAKFCKVTENLHHLVSTKTCPGVYNSPYALDGVPTVFGIPVEEHLRMNTKTYLQREGLKSVKPKRKRNKSSLQAETEYDATRTAHRAESRLSKTKRMSSRDFIAGGKGTLGGGYTQGVSHGTKYVDAWRITQSSRTKTRFSDQAPFYASVKNGRIFDDLADEAAEREMFQRNSEELSYYDNVPTSAGSQSFAYYSHSR